MENGIDNASKTRQRRIKTFKKPQITECVEIEKAFLRSILSDGNQLTPYITGLVKIRSFYLYIHQVIYKTFLSLDKSHDPINEDTIIDRIKYFRLEEWEREEIEEYIKKELTGYKPSKHTEYHARVIVQYAIARCFYNVADTLSGDDNEDLIYFAYKELQTLIQHLTVKHYISNMNATEIKDNAIKALSDWAKSSSATPTEDLQEAIDAYLEVYPANGSENEEYVIAHREMAIEHLIVKCIRLCNSEELSKMDTAKHCLASNLPPSLKEKFGR